MKKKERGKKKEKYHQEKPEKYIKIKISKYLHKKKVTIKMVYGLYDQTEGWDRKILQNIQIINFKLIIILDMIKRK